MPRHPIVTPASLSRRRFLTRCALAGGTLAVSGWASLCDIPVSQEALAQPFPDGLGGDLTFPARYWTAANAPNADCALCHQPGDGVSGTQHPHKKALVRCQLCANACVLAPGERGACRTRVNVDGELKTLVYGRPVSIHVDPIEKKPFYHFLPGSLAFSLATAGCPLSCRFCQNWEISQAGPEDFRVPFTPARAIVQKAVDQRAPIIAYTYNEPTVFAEYLIDIARMARRQSIRNVMISCGYTGPAALPDLCEVLDAIKIDLKGYDPGFYRTVCKAELAPVLTTIQEVARRGVHLEIVNLVVPTLNDGEPMLRDLCRWIADHVGQDVPVHFTRFHPDYQMRDLPPTPVETLERARTMAVDCGLRYAYVGNVPGHPGNHTYCPSCGKVVVARNGFFLTGLHLNAGRCAFCQTAVAGVWGI